MNTGHDPLVERLQSLSAALVVEPAPDDLAQNVLARVADEPAPRPSPMASAASWLADWAATLRSPRRALAAALSALALTVALVPPVRAEVASWFGIVVQETSRPAPSAAPPPPAATGNVSLDQARSLVAFRPAIPAILGDPDAVEVSADRRVLSMSWSGGPDGPLRLDQFDGGISPLFLKTVWRDGGVEGLDIGGQPALWFPLPHELVVLGRDNVDHRYERTSGPTLAWQRAGTTLRLEGAVTRERAVQLAESTVDR
jgi:hypothetical protein